MLLLVTVLLLQNSSASLINATGFFNQNSAIFQPRSLESNQDVSDAERQAQRREEQRRLTNYYRAQYFSRTQEEFLALLEYLNSNNN